MHWPFGSSSLCSPQPPPLDSLGGRNTSFPCIYPHGCNDLTARLRMYLSVSVSELLWCGVVYLGSGSWTCPASFLRIALDSPSACWRRWPWGHLICSFIFLDDPEPERTTLWKIERETLTWGSILPLAESVVIAPNGCLTWTLSWRYFKILAEVRTLAV